MKNVFILSAHDSFNKNRVYYYFVDKIPVEKMNNGKFTVFRYDYYNIGMACVFLDQVRKVHYNFYGEKYKATVYKKEEILGLFGECKYFSSKEIEFKRV